tara:strand:+ start:687 stop:830 length:144 start_codon:yes stop_codon:yes gene_type:complete
MINDQTTYDDATAQAIAALDRAILQEIAELERQAGRYKLSNTNDRED